MIQASLQILRLYLSSRTRGQHGVTAIEYAIMLALIALAVVAFGPGISNSIQAVFADTQNSLSVP